MINMIVIVEWVPRTIVGRQCQTVFAGTHSIQALFETKALYVGLRY